MYEKLLTLEHLFPGKKKEQKKVEIRKAMGVIYLKQEKLERAKEHFISALLKSQAIPGGSSAQMSMDILYRIGQICFETQDLSQGEQYLLKSLELYDTAAAPNTKELYGDSCLMLAQILIKAGKLS